MIESVEGVEDHLDQAFIAAASGKPGPAVLMLPVDLHRAEAGAPSARRARLDAWPIDRPRPSDTDIAAAADVLAGARRPAIVAGGGIHGSGAGGALLALAERIGAPVTTTNMGKGAIPETHPLAAGAIGNLTGPGGLGRHCKAIVREADAILLVGTRTHEDGTDKWTLIPSGPPVVHIDIDPQEIGRNYEALRLLGDARETLIALSAALENRTPLGDRAVAESRVAEAWARFEQERAPFLADTVPIRPERTLAAIQQRLQPGTVIVSDASYSSSWIVGQLRTSSPDTRIISPRGLAGLGWGLPLALGAKLARPGAEVIAVVGDGGFAHAWAEMETAVGSGLAVTVVVLNNGVLGYQKDAEHVKFGRYTAAGHLGRVDHAAIARAVGATGLTIAAPDQLEDALSQAAAGGTLTLLDVDTDPGAHPPISLYAGTLDRIEGGVVKQEAVA